MKVLFITSDREHCGIREYGNYLQAAMKQHDPQLEFVEVGPDAGVGGAFDLVHINHHAALHSRWTPERIRSLFPKIPVVVTQHDTFETAAIMQERGLECFITVAQVVTHEKVDGYLTWVIPQGVLPGPVPKPPVHYNRLGVFGFDFPWKGFDDAAEVAERLGMSLMIVSPGMELDRAGVLFNKSNDRGGTLHTGWPAAEAVVQLLAGNLANLFLYSCGNSGTSGAIRLGLAARRPVIAYAGCRQFRDLHDGPGVLFADDKAAVVRGLKLLQHAPHEREAMQLATRRAESDSWVHAAKAYHHVYTRAMEKTR